MRQLLASPWALFRHLCFGCGLLAVLFLWPTTPAKSPSILNESNRAANFCSARLFIKGYEAISTANGTSKVKHLRRKDILIISYESPKYCYHADSLTFRKDDFFSTGLKVLALLALFLFAYTPQRWTCHSRFLSFAVGCASFLAFFALRAVAYGLAAHFFRAATIIWFADPIVRVLLLLAALIIALGVLKVKEGATPKASPTHFRYGLLLSLVPCLLVGCSGNISNNNVTIVVGGTGDSWIILLLGVGMMLWPHIRDSRTRRKAEEKDVKPPKSARTGFTQRQIAKWFQVTEREVKRWESGAATPPNGFSKELRLSGDFERLQVVLKAYWDVKRSQGGDAYSSKMILRGLSDEEAYRRRQR